MGYAVLSTWKMSFNGALIAGEVLKNGGTPLEAIKAGINDVENNPDYLSVGYGGLPNREGEVELDAAIMDGSTGLFGGIMGVKGIANPIDVALDLSQKRLNCLLCGTGAEKYARLKGFEFKNMLTEKAKKQWEEQEIKNNDAESLVSYNGHDTVSFVARQGTFLAAGVSTSGIFLKVPGRVGDSPIVGGGLYSDSEAGAAAATGDGEDILRGCLSYEIVRQMESGKTAMEACETTLCNHLKKMNRKGLKIGPVSLIALDADGGFGAATSLNEFAFIYTDNSTPPAVWIAGAKTGVVKATGERLSQYTRD
ncbi:MAG: isoaspartyl peptidase/L-asparaginase [Treponema sp.]|jgi:N4-(beta-N-acetylglucosaminyl)-L-asparaginase|nr:isoaspartyl peptidase/L-asparaginase [Treponema sp.]